MKQNYLLGLYEKAMPDTLTWNERFKLAEKYGYDFIEISIDETDMRLERLYSQSFQKTLKEAMECSKVKIRSMCLSGHRKYALGSTDNSTRDKGLDIFYKAVDFAFLFGIPIIQLAGYDVYYEKGTPDTEKRFESYLRLGVEYASSRGILCGFETMETPFMNTVKKAKKYVDIVNSPFLQIYPDLGNLTNAALSENHNLYEDLYCGEGHLIAAHIKETIPGVFRNMHFGTGHVEFGAGIEALWNAGVRIYGCEFWYQEGHDYHWYLKESSDFVRGYLEAMIEVNDED